MSVITLAANVVVAPPDALLGWFMSGYGFVFVAIVSFFTSLIASWVIELAKTTFAKNVENHKFNLRRAELFFEREIEAASQFVSLREKLNPVFTPNNDSFYDACVDIAGRFSLVEEHLKAYLMKHRVVLPHLIRTRLDQLSWMAGERKFEQVDMEDDPSSASIELASEIFTSLLEIEETLINDLKKPQ